MLSGPGALFLLNVYIAVLSSCFMKGGDVVSGAVIDVTAFSELPYIFSVNSW